MNRIELLKETVEKVDTGMSGTIGLVEYLESHGIEEGMHVGKSPDFFEGNNDRIAEWYLGQFMNIILNESWFAMNTLINQSSVWTERNYNE